jgi:hypothetical protein
MATRTIRIACKGSRMAALDGLVIIQGDLKELSEENYAKLRRRIETLGFDAPVFVWHDKVLDGTQRCRVLRTMLEEGWVLPGGEVPVCDILAETLAEAKDRLLGYVSQYGRLTRGGLRAFLEGMDMTCMETLNLPGYGLGEDRPGDVLGGGGGDLAQPGLQGDDVPRQMQVMCPECGEEFLINGG